MSKVSKADITQFITERDLAEGIFDAKVAFGRLRECGFYIRRWDRKFEQEDHIQVTLFGVPFKALVISIKQTEADLEYIKAIVKWDRRIT